MAGGRDADIAEIDPRTERTSCVAAAAVRRSLVWQDLCPLLPTKPSTAEECHDVLLARLARLLLADASGADRMATCRPESRSALGSEKSNSQSCDARRGGRARRTKEINAWRQRGAGEQDLMKQNYM